MEVIAPKKQRIEYLDALRGFTMLLVVIQHIATYCLDVNDGYHEYLKQFRMPLFFFVSGFVLYKKDFLWNFVNSFNFIKKKIIVQIVSPFIFFFAYIYIKDIDFINAILNPGKAGYWFTFMLFEYFIAYIIFQWIARLLKISSNTTDILIIIYALCVTIVPYMNQIIASLHFVNNESLITTTIATQQNITQSMDVPHSIGVGSGIIGFFGLANFIYFIFFITGTLVRKHFNLIQNKFDNTHFISMCIIIYLGINIFCTDELKQDIFVKIILKITLGLCGIFIILFTFRKYQDKLTKTTKLGSSLQFIGRRTLDIYLLHYFFLPMNLKKISYISQISEFNIPILEFTLSLVIAALVLGACLTMSCILRLHPGMAHFLFGAKKECVKK